MGNRTKITMAGARGFAPADGREAVLWDSAARGLGLRARPNGRKTWIVHRRRDAAPAADRVQAGEIRRLRWCEVKPDRLALIDAKTGPRHVLLGEAARELLDGLAETASGEWVFPGDRGSGPLSTNELWTFWTRVRDAAGIVAVRGCMTCDTRTPRTRS